MTRRNAYAIAAAHALWRQGVTCPSAVRHAVALALFRYDYYAAPPRRGR